MYIINDDVTKQMTVRPRGTMYIVCIALLSIITSSKAQCGYPYINLTATNLTGTVYSPNWPLNYNDNDRCSWRLSAPVGTGRVQLTVAFGDFYCCCKEDRLRIYDGSDEYAPVIAQLCSGNNPVSVTSSGPYLYGVWQTNGEGTAMGYALQYTYHDVSVSCPPGWVEWSDHCYKLYDDDLTWQDALNRCGYDAGYLASIATYEENEFIHTTFRNSSNSSKSSNSSNSSTTIAWIGMGSNNQWTDGTPLTYLNFGSTFPGQCGAVNLSADHVTLTWRTQDCHAPSQGFICKKRRDGTGARYWPFVDDEDNDSGGGGWNYGFLGFIFLAFFWCSAGHRSRGNRARTTSRPPPPQPRPQPARSPAATSSTTPSANGPTVSVINVDSNSASDPQPGPSTTDQEAPPPFQLAFKYGTAPDENSDLPPPPSYEESVKL